MEARSMDVAIRGRMVAGERSLVRHVDFTLVIAAVGLAVCGVLMVYSSTVRSLEAFNQDPGFYLKRQVAFLALGLVAMVVAAALDYRVVKIYAPFAYITFVALLILVQTPLGTPALGAQRSFLLWGFQFSPAMFTRVALVLMLAASLSQIKGEVSREDVAWATLTAALPMALVFIQPDIGTTIVLASILVALLVVSGAKARYLAVLALVAMVAMFGAFQLHIVKDYQVLRLTSFFDPEADPQRAGYNRQQAEIAIGAGGIFGRGYLQGTQTNLDYVPAQHTDFIFTVVGEEFGFAGAGGLLLLFGLLLWRALRIAQLSKDPFGTFVAVGVGAMIATQVFVNVGMTIGIMPITGIPLPFVSYGGSALIADFIGIGLLLNVHMRRFA
jgi:rod shape determining protein RodA